MNCLFRLLLTFNATALIFVVYAIKQKIVINVLVKYFTNLPDFLSSFFINLPHCISYIFYFLIPVLLTMLSLYISKFLSDDAISSTDNSPVILEVEQANNAYLPSYLGYFFVALSVSHWTTLIYIFAILFIFTFKSQTLYFNPLFLLFKYHFYYVTTVNKLKVFVITRKTINKPDSIQFPKLKRINDFTFIERD